MEMKPKYNPNEVESGRYDQWVNNGYFKATEDSSKELKPSNTQRGNANLPKLRRHSRRKQKSAKE
ncbi:MAG: hypothetical protein HFE56_02160 [Staphylococcus xylosus]|nr:hypothetical protein [Staphylococcus xylosus]